MYIVHATCWQFLYANFDVIAGTLYHADEAFKSNVANALHMAICLVNGLPSNCFEFAFLTISAPEIEYKIDYLIQHSNA